MQQDTPYGSGDGRRGTDGSLAVLAPRLRASWRRSERYGVTPEEMRPVFTGAVDKDSLLYECGHEVLRRLQATLAGEPLSMMITSSDGLVLCRLCNDASISRSLDRVNLAPGFCFAENNVGTNGLGLALADRTPSIVRADEHYCTRLRGYTCAAVPVLDPVTGDLAGSVNLTTWSDSSSALLLALAQAAAGHTTALMLARGSGRRTRPTPRGEVFRVYADRFGAADDTPGPLSPAWTGALERARTALGRGQVVAVVGEPGAGRTALASLARQGAGPRERVLRARPPAAEEIDAWLTVWLPELHKDSTCVILSDVETLPAWAATETARHFTAVRRPAPAGGPPPVQPFVLTARDYASIPEALKPLVASVVEAPALRTRPDDVLPLAHHFARRYRGRPVTFTAAAAAVLTGYDWPENARQLQRVVHDAVSRTEVVDKHHLPAEVFAGGDHRLTRLQILERDEIVRCLTEPGVTVAQAADNLGMSRATVYRKMAQYGIRIPGRTPPQRT
ncbi:GAF domain-containing protein [Streptomyces minutiscleroticus]|nr:GAF domain-containing protein [Streptomyces minutiscleroticus]